MEDFRKGLLRWKISGWDFSGGRFPGGTSPVEDFRVGLLRWKISGWDFSGGRFPGGTSSVEDFRVGLLDRLESESFPKSTVINLDNNLGYLQNQNIQGGVICLQTDRFYFVFRNI